MTHAAVALCLLLAAPALLLLAWAMLAMGRDAHARACRDLAILALAAAGIFAIQAMEG